MPLYIDVFLFLTAVAVVIIMIVAPIASFIAREQLANVKPLFVHEMALIVFVGFVE